MAFGGGLGAEVFWIEHFGFVPMLKQRQVNQELAAASYIRIKLHSIGRNENRASSWYDLTFYNKPYKC